MKKPLAVIIAIITLTAKVLTAEIVDFYGGVNVYTDGADYATAAGWTVMSNEINSNATLSASEKADAIAVLNHFATNCINHNSASDKNFPSLNFSLGSTTP